MAAENQLRFVRNVLYGLKRSWGSQADIYYQSSETVNLETGRKTVVKEKHKVRRAILLPTVVSRKEIYDLSYIAANKNFTYGGTFQKGDRIVVFDRRDLPKDYVMELENTYIIIDHRRYEIVSVEELDQKAGYYVKIRELKGAQLYQIVEITVRERITISQDVGVTP